MIILAELVFLAMVLGSTTGHQNHAKIPIYSTNIKGWVEIWPLDDNPTTDGVNVNFKLDIVGKMPNTLEFWSTNTPLVYGSDPCPDFRANAEIFDQKFANFSTTENNNNNKIEENAIIKNVTFEKLLFRSLVVVGDGRTAACANILTRESKIFQAKFYGPNVGGNIFAYLNENLKLLKISARILNANNFETNLRWSMKKFWWLPKQDDREPGIISCREKSRNAFVWYEPDANNTWSYVTPERPQLIEIPNFDLTSDNLAKAVFVLEKSSDKQWESNKATGCARFHPTWDGGLGSQVCSSKGELLSLSQETLFDPILVRKLNENCEHKIKNESLDLENFDDLLKIGADVGVKPGASISQFVDHVTVNESTKAIAHYFYPMAGQVLFEQAKNNPNSFTVVSGHLVDLFDEYPATIGADMQIMRLPSESTLDGMSCFKWKEMFNPGEMDDNFCQKSDKLCPIGRSPFKARAFANLGSATWGQEPAINPYNTSSQNRAHFKFIVDNWPLDGPFSILGQTLNVSTNFLQACANISTRVESGLISGGRRFTFDGSAPDTASLACTFDQDSVLNEMFESYLQSLVANFKGAIFEGSVYFTQYNEEDNHAVPLGRTGVYMIKKSEGNRSTHVDQSGFTFEICETNSSQLCSELAIYNPFGVDMTPDPYLASCGSDSQLCAIGDLGNKAVATMTRKNGSCFKVVPLSGSFSVKNKMLRLKRHVNGKTETICSTLNQVKIKDVIIRASKQFSQKQVEEIILNDLNADSLSLRAQKTKVKKISKNCDAYRVSLFGPDVVHYAEMLNLESKNGNYTLSKTLKAEQCSSAIVTLYSLLVLLPVVTIFSVIRYY